MANLPVAERIIEKINADNAKRAALLIVLVFTVYHAIIHLRYGSDSCKWLLSNGRYKGDEEWQPYGCMLHFYSQIDTRKCFRYLAFWGTHSHFVFIGDSRIKELYTSFLAHLQIPNDGIQAPVIQKNHTFQDTKLLVQADFYWSPYLSNSMVDLFWSWTKSVPTVIVAGCGIQIMRESNGSTAVLNEYIFNLTRLVQPIAKMKVTKLLWVLQEPVNPSNLKPEWEFLTNELIDAYNDATVEVLNDSPLSFWWSARLVAKGMLRKSPDGIHLADKALEHKTQILLNMYCNDNMNYNDGTCCSSAENYTTLQVVTFAFLGMCATVGIVMVLHRGISKCSGKRATEYTLLRQENATNSEQTDLYTLFTSLAKAAFIMTFFYLCDRTNFFMKENKYYSEFSFWIPVGYVFALGLFFTDDSRFTKVLHKNQTDEWKGWMQLIILIYHLTGAERVLPIYMHIKVLISAYLFLLGYSYFFKIWHTGDISAIKFFRTLFRLNFITITLCLCMNRPYQFYYIAPLLSFWFCMIYVVLALPPRITAQSSESNPLQILYLTFKFVGFFSVVTILYMSEVFFEKVFVTRPWKALFVTTDDDIHDWWSRWKLDRYSALYGMIFSLAFLMLQRFNFVDDNNPNNLFSRGIALSATLAAFLGIGSYVTFTYLCRNRLECEEVHSYIVFIPIVSYIVLRNISGALRLRYSSLFAWFGRISLELFVCQYHIWLAADTHGVLVLIPGYPVLNVLITSFILICVASEVNKLTKVLVPYAIPSDWKLVLRNFFLFLAVLVPIGINDGMF